MEVDGIVMPEGWTPPEEHIEFLGHDSNAGAIMGTVMRALRKVGNDKSVIDDYVKQAWSGDYNNLLRVSMAFVDYHGQDD